MDKYIYTIIIPHHNIPTLLRRCLKSIPQREDLQTIVIDDNSDIKYKTEIQLLEKEFPQVYFHYLEKNEGGGKARNIGLQLAQGKYILFADSDDYFNYCFNSILSDYASSEYDIIFFNANSLETDTYKPTWRSLHLNKMVKSFKKNPSKAIFKLKYAFGEPWCKMVKRNLIQENHISFDETKIHNDTKYSYLVGFYSKQIHVDERAIYCVTDRINSVSKDISADKLLTRTIVFSNANAFFKINNIRLFDERAIRPLIYFLLHKKLNYAKKCNHILRGSGMSQMDIITKIIIFPFLILPIITLKAKKTVLSKLL